MKLTEEQINEIKDQTSQNNKQRVTSPELEKILMRPTRFDMGLLESLIT